MALTSMHRWAGIPLPKLVDAVDVMPDPKREPVNLICRHAPARLRKLMVPRDGDRRLTAPGYNDALRELILKHWDPERAQARSPSLARARQRIAAWRPIAKPWLLHP